MFYRGYQRFSLGPVGFLIIANLIMFILVLIQPDLISRLGLKPALFLTQPWTIVTNLFVHGGIWHILTNMFTLYFFGSYLTGLIGERNFFITYFGGGLLGNILYMVLGPSFSTVIGASGAVFAVGGALAVLRPKLPVLTFPIPAPLPLWVTVIFGFLLISFFPSVAWQAHLGGLVFGLAAAYFFWRKRG